MKWLGHYEFGGNFKPINFRGWLGDSEAFSAVDEAFWLDYWSNAYSYAIDQGSDRVGFFDYDELLQGRSRS